jgi:uncharacterized protein (UPF0128 family)
MYHTQLREKEDKILQKLEHPQSLMLLYPNKASQLSDTVAEQQNIWFYTKFYKRRVVTTSPLPFLSHENFSCAQA